MLHLQEVQHLLPVRLKRTINHFLFWPLQIYALPVYMLLCLYITDLENVYTCEQHSGRTNFEYFPYLKMKGFAYLVAGYLYHSILVYIVLKVTIKMLNTIIINFIIILLFCINKKMFVKDISSYFLYFSEFQTDLTKAINKYESFQTHQIINNVQVLHRH